MADEDPFYVSVRTNIVAFLLGSVLYALSVIILVNYSSLKLNLLSQIELSQLFNSQILAVSVDSSVTLLVSSVAFASSSSCFVLLPATELYRFTLAQSEQPGMYPLDLAWLDWDLVSSLWSYSLWSIQLSIYFFCPFAYFFNESFGPWSHRFRETSLLLFIFWIFLYGFIYLGQSTFTFVQSSYFKSTDVPLSLLLNSVVSTLGLLLALAALPIGMLAILTKPLDLLLPLDHNSRMAERLLELDFAKASLENRLHDLSSKLETLDNPQRTPSQALSALAGGSSQRHKSTTTTTTTIASAMAAQPKFTMYSRPTRLLRREIVQSWRHIERLESERQQIGQELGHLSPYWRLAVATVLLLIVWFAFLVTMAWIQLQFLSKVGADPDLYRALMDLWHAAAEVPASSTMLLGAYESLSDFVLSSLPDEEQELIYTLTHHPDIVRLLPAATLTARIVSMVFVLGAAIVGISKLVPMIRLSLGIESKSSSSIPSSSAIITMLLVSSCSPPLLHILGVASVEYLGPFALYQISDRLVWIYSGIVSFAGTIVVISGARNIIERTVGR